MRPHFQKVKTVHHVLSEFFPFLLDIEKNPEITRIIPGRISRQQKGSSHLNFVISYPTQSGLKCIISKGATAQELFVICASESVAIVGKYLLTTWKQFYG